MKEIGGYIEFESYHLPMLHDEAVKLNCGRNCLAYLIKTRHIKKICLPSFLCDSIRKVCEKYQVCIRYYHIDSHFCPQDIELAEDEWLYIVDFYGQLSREQIKSYSLKFKRIIVDYSQAYFEMPLEGVDSFYTCRKYFGVPDGALLYTNTDLNQKLEQDESLERMHFLLGRFERSASEFYKEYVDNNHLFATEPIKRMSKLTENLLHGIDYERVKTIRNRNYQYLYDRMEDYNQLELKYVEGAFAYPLMIKNGSYVRKKLIEEKIYIPILWPNVLHDVTEDTFEFNLSNNILPIPCDQRYDVEDIEKICLIIEQLL